MLPPRPEGRGLRKPKTMTTDIVLTLLALLVGATTIILTVQRSLNELEDTFLEIMHRLTVFHRETLPALRDACMGRAAHDGGRTANGRTS